MSRIPSSSKTPDKPNPVDLHVGRRVRLRRTLLGMTQEQLGEALGLTFQQIQKYERGANRVDASRLYDLARILDVPVGFFFEDMPRDFGPDFPGTPFADALPVSPAEQAFRRETLELVRAYCRITDPLVRRGVFDLAKALADPAD